MLLSAKINNRCRNHSNLEKNELQTMQRGIPTSKSSFKNLTFKRSLNYYPWLGTVQQKRKQFKCWRIKSVNNAKSPSHFLQHNYYPCLGPDWALCSAKILRSTTKAENSQRRMNYALFLEHNKSIPIFLKLISSYYILKTVNREWIIRSSKSTTSLTSLPESLPTAAIKLRRLLFGEATKVNMG